MPWTIRATRVPQNECSIASLAVFRLGLLGHGGACLIALDTTLFCERHPGMHIAADRPRIRSGRADKRWRAEGSITPRTTATSGECIAPDRRLTVPRKCNTRETLELNFVRLRAPR